MPIEQQNRILCFAGRKGSGKSTKVREVMEYVATHHPNPRMFTYDTMGEHRWMVDSFDDQQETIIYLMQSHTYADFLARYVPETDDEKKDFADICGVVYEQGNMLFLAEEIPMLGNSPNYAVPKYGRIIRLGRHRNIDHIFTVQRISEAPRVCTSQTDIFVLFAQAEPVDLERIEERCGPEIANKVAGFQGHEFLVYDVAEKKEVSHIDVGCMMVPLSSLKFQPQIQTA